MARPKKIKKEKSQEKIEVQELGGNITSPTTSSEQLFLKIALISLLKKKMPTCFDREPQGMNSGVEKLAEEILKLCLN